MEKKIKTKFKKQVTEISHIWKKECKAATSTLLLGSIVISLISVLYYAMQILVINFFHDTNLLANPFFIILVAEASFSLIILFASFVIAFRYKNIAEHNRIESSYWVYGIFWTLYSLFLVQNIADCWMVWNIYHNIASDGNYGIFLPIFRSLSVISYILKGAMIIFIAINLYKGISLNLKLADIKKQIYLSYKSGYKFIDFQNIPKKTN